MTSNTGRSNRWLRVSALLGVFTPLAALSSCKSYPPIQTVEKVDLDRFMGNWYVIAHIPASIERDSFNATESYRLESDGTIDVTFRFNEGALDGEVKEYNFPGFVRDDGSNAVWGVQVFWPIKAEYRVVYLDEDYSQTIIGRTKRDYVWIMARSPSVSESDYRRLVGIVQDRGYSLEGLRRVPHSPE